MSGFQNPSWLQIALGDVELAELKAPFLSQWTYGAEWAKARILVSDDQSVRIQIPDSDSDELKFEVHYRAWFGIAYLGLGRKHFTEQAFDVFLDKLKASVQQSVSASSAVKMIMGGHADGVHFDSCVFGVANAWLENPRHTVPSTTSATVTGLGQDVAIVKDIFAAGADNPIMCEIIDTEQDVWLAFQISAVRAGKHFVDEAQAERIMTEVLKLS